MQLWLRMVLWLLGGTLLALAALIYEDEEKKIQSRLEDCWLWLEENRTRALLLEHNVVGRLASAASRLLGGLYGPNLLTTRAAAVSVAISLTVVGILSLILYPFNSQASILFLPILLLATIDLYMLYKHPKWGKSLCTAIVVLIACYLTTKRVTFERSARSVPLGSLGEVYIYLFELLIAGTALFMVITINLLVIAILRKVLLRMRVFRSVVVASLIFVGVFILVILLYEATFVHISSAAPPKLFSLHYYVEKWINTAILLVCRF